MIFFSYFCGMEIIYEIIAFVILVAIPFGCLAVFSIGAIYEEIKEAKNQDEENKTIVVNIVLTQKEEEEEEEKEEDSKS